MTLNEQIAQITNPQEFTRLCNAILTEKYGRDFQVIDGTRGDEGNDGYVISEKRVIAIYCPIKPERKKDLDYVTKISSDLKKAQTLRDTNQLCVENWTFLTPRKLSNQVVIKMRKQAELLGLKATHQESTYLANELYRNKHLIEAFPTLNLSDINSKLDEIFNYIKQENYSKDMSKPELDKKNIYNGKTQDEEELNQVFNIRRADKDETTKSNLRSIYYKTSDPVVKINSLLGLIDFYDPLEDNSFDIVTICNDGVVIAEQERIFSIKAYFLAHKAYMLSFIYCDLDIKTTAQIMAGNAIGFHTITEEYRLEVVKKLTGLEVEFNQLFAEAIELCKNNNDFDALASVLILIGNAAGQRALYLQPLGVADRAASERIKCKHALLAAKDIYSHFNDELSVANALFNLANQIRFFGEVSEAISIVKDSITVSKKYGDNRLLKRAQWLLHSLESGYVPDYLAGERRE